MQLFGCRRWNMAKAKATRTILSIDAIEKQHMKMDIQIEC